MIFGGLDDTSGLLDENQQIYDEISIESDGELTQSDNDYIRNIIDESYKPVFNKVIEDYENYIELIKTQYKHADTNYLLCLTQHHLEFISYLQFSDDIIKEIETHYQKIKSEKQINSSIEHKIDEYKRKSDLVLKRVQKNLT